MEIIAEVKRSERMLTEQTKTRKRRSARTRGRTRVEPELDFSLVDESLAKQKAARHIAILAGLLCVVVHLFRLTVHTFLNLGSLLQF